MNINTLNSVFITNPILMKTEKAIIYDDNCPMCRWYTQAFVNADLLAENNRISFSELAASPLVEQIEMHRSKHEIPLVDLEGGKTIYGVDSLVHLLSPRLPILRQLMDVGPIAYMIKKLYKFISYNRGIMAPSYPNYRKYDCTPDFHLGYRLLLILLLGGSGLWLGSSHITYFGGGDIALYAGLILLLAGLPFLGTHYISYLGHLSIVLFLAGIVIKVGNLFPGLGSVFSLFALSIFIWQYVRRYHILWAQMRWIKKRN